MERDLPILLDRVALTVRLRAVEELESPGHPDGAGLDARILIELALRLA